jgi:UDP-N-acetylglucosamine:LPS N-acetylglucosamine transferase
MKEDSLSKEQRRQITFFWSKARTVPCRLPRVYIQDVVAILLEIFVAVTIFGRDLKLPIPVVVQLQSSVPGQENKSRSRGIKKIKDKNNPMLDC